MSKKINALLIQPMKAPKAIEIDTDIHELQKLVDGYVEVFYPFPVDEFAACLVDEEGKLTQKPFNRALRDSETGRIYDLVMGDLIIVGLDQADSDFCSLSDEQVQKFSKQFHQAEILVNVNGSLAVISEEPQE